MNKYEVLVSVEVTLPGNEGKPLEENYRHRNYTIGFNSYIEEKSKVDSVAKSIQHMINELTGVARV